MKIESTGFPDGLDAMCNRKRGGEYDFINFGFSNYKKWELSMTDMKKAYWWSRFGGRKRSAVPF